MFNSKYYHSRREFLRSALTFSGAAALPTSALAFGEMPTNPADMSIVEALGQMRTGALAPKELLAACLQRIGQFEPQLKAFVTDTFALAEAQSSESELRYLQGEARALEGIPFGLKDLYYTEGIRTTAGAKAFENFVPEFDARVYEKLKGAGGSLLGKLNTHEFAFGAATPPTRNPWNTRLTPGGSSGGSAAMVAARCMPTASASDTAGSIRIPSSVCGLVGMKPTYGLISRRGIVGLNWSMDHPGMLARTMTDSILLTQLLQGPDAADPSTLENPPTDYPISAPDSLHGVRLGVPSFYFWDNIEPDIELVCRQALRQLEALGAEIVEFDLPPSFSGALDMRDDAELDLPNLDRWRLAGLINELNLGMPGFRTLGKLSERLGFLAYSLTGAIFFIEAAAYHKRLRKEAPMGYSWDSLLALKLGDLFPATSYLRIQQLRSAYLRDMKATYEKYELTAVVHPTVPVAPPKQLPKGGIFGAGLLNGAALGSLTLPWDVLGFPSMSVPVGLDEGGIPVGLTLNGLPLDEPVLYGIGLALEEEIPFYKQTPGILA